MGSFNRFPVVPRVSEAFVDGIGRDKCLGDIDQLKTLRIIGSTTTAFVYERDGSDHAMQSCKRWQWSPCRAKLINLTQSPQRNNSFLATHFTFSDGDRIYVGSEIAHMCLSDIIHCVAMTDEHVGAVLSQVRKPSKNQCEAEDPGRSSPLAHRARRYGIHRPQSLKCLRIGGRRYPAW